MQKTVLQVELPRKNAWFVKADGTNAQAMVGNARDVIVQEGLPWFERFRDPLEVRRTLVEADEQMHGGTFGFGNNPSPIRSYMLGYVSKHLGDTGGAIQCFQDLIKSGKMAYVNGR